MRGNSKRVGGHEKHRPLLVEIVTLIGQRPLERIGRHPAHADSAGIIVGLWAVLARDIVMNPAIALIVVLTREPNGKGIGQRNIDAAIDDVSVEVKLMAIVDVVSKLEFGLMSSNCDRTNTGVLSEKRRLRAFDHLDIVDVEQRRAIGLAMPLKDAIDVQGNRLVER